MKTRKSIASSWYAQTAPCAPGDAQHDVLGPVALVAEGPDRVRDPAPRWRPRLRGRQPDWIDTNGLGDARERRRL